MEKESDLNLLHPRSMAAVIRDGYRLYLSSFKKLFRSSWIVAIVYAIAFALMMGNVVNNVVPMQAVMRAFGPQAVMADASYASTSLLSFLTSVFFALAALLLAAQAFRAFDEHRHTDAISRPARWYGRLCLPAFLRLLPVALWMLLLAVVIGCAFYAVGFGILSLGVVGNVWKSIASLCLFALLLIVVTALLVPLAYTVMRKMLASSSSLKGICNPRLSTLKGICNPRLSTLKGICNPRLSTLKGICNPRLLVPPFQGYARGLRHWGLLFAVLFVVYIFTELLTLVCELPAVIIAIANSEAYAGLALGDPLGLPEHIVPWTYCVFALAGFIQAYVHLSTLFPLYYAYGSIEQQEAERMKIDN